MTKIERERMERLKALAMYEEAGIQPISGGDGTGDPPEGDPPTGDPPVVDPPKPTKIEFSPEQQTYLNSLIAEESRKAAEKAANEAITATNLAAEEERKKAMRGALKEQQKWETLAGEYETENKRLTDEVTRLTGEMTRLGVSAQKYEETVLADYDDYVQTMPTAFRPFDPGPDASVDAKRSFMEMARLGQAEVGAPFVPGTPPSPPPKRPGNGEPELIEQEVADLRRNPQYSRLGV